MVLNRTRGLNVLITAFIFVVRRITPFLATSFLHNKWSEIFSEICCPWLDAKLSLVHMPTTVQEVHKLGLVLQWEHTVRQLNPVTKIHHPPLKYWQYISWLVNPFVLVLMQAMHTMLRRSVSTSKRQATVQEEDRTQSLCQDHPQPPSHWLVSFMDGSWIGWPGDHMAAGVSSRGHVLIICQG